MNGGKKFFTISPEERSADPNFMRVTLALNAWDQKFVAELAAGEGKSVPAFIGTLVRKRLEEVRTAAKR
jgi:hypothetical protein